ncbi:MAG TPA: FAD-binding domain-containing protein [Paraburkholderia sp.]|uniref:FAD-binding domain-containing protein n=1 Tax=Paraburkholderia sp. TaxID=1926495 RepID=UPI002BD2A8D1|nr:FAD-binding domain-containing protein [Paraburkholderia sp.]HTR09750.1 FAD-binding domain-containing protein [Paraburkholderia sp.]
MSRALIWFKRDLRIHDHAALAAAAACDDGFALVVIEPEWLASPECDAQHVAFLGACVHSLRQALGAVGLPLLVRMGSMPDVLEALHRETAFTHLFSHEETGPLWSYARDCRVAGWCSERGVAWQEDTQTGVVRGLRSRDGWARRWEARMSKPPVRLSVPRAVGGLTYGVFPSLHELGLRASRPLPAAGEEAARVILDDFLNRRGRCYRAELSSPLTAERACSRLSAHLAFGTISMRQVHEATQSRIARLLADRDPTAKRFAWHLRGFSGRLRWHCHFIQKLEDEPETEHRNLAGAADGLREHEFNRRFFDAWCEGRTGYPMVDACMRQLLATGWLNFRMRAMLVSFAAYHLWLHWREPGLHLARQFLDFEPGIHWSQMQMQSGTTGINTLRIYSPARQAADLDPCGTYVRRWVPEYGTADYPPPIVDERSALATAKARLYTMRGTEAAREEADAIQRRHGSRRSGLAHDGARRRRTRRSSSPLQKELFE